MRAALVLLAACGSPSNGAPDAGTPCAPFTAQVTTTFDGAPVRTPSGWGLLESNRNYRHVTDDGTVSLPVPLPDFQSKNLARYGSGLAYVGRPAEGLQLITFDQSASELSRSETLLPPLMMTYPVLASRAEEVIAAYGDVEGQVIVARYDEANGWRTTKYATGPRTSPVAIAGPIGVSLYGFSPGNPNGCLEAGPDWKRVMGFACPSNYGLDSVDSDGEIALLATKGNIYKITRGGAVSVVRDYARSVAIAWTGEFWQFVVNDAAGKLTEHRLDKSFAPIASIEVATTSVPTHFVVGAARDRALIVASDLLDARTSELIQVCF